MNVHSVLHSENAEERHLSNTIYITVEFQHGISVETKECKNTCLFDFLSNVADKNYMS